MIMMEIVSKNIPESVRDQLMQHSTSSPKVWQLAYEFCKAFSTEIIGLTQPEFTSRSGLRVATSEGFSIGVLRYETVLGEDQYSFTSHIIVMKDRSGKTSRECRAAKSISALIKAVKTKDRPISNEGISSYLAKDTGIDYAFRALQKEAGENKTRLIQNMFAQLGDDQKISLVDHVLNGSRLDDIARDTLAISYSSFLKATAQSQEVMKDLIRYSEGSYLVGIVAGGIDEDRHYEPSGATSYVVCDNMTASVDVNGGYVNDIKFHAPLKHYSTLADHPVLAPIAMMIRTAITPSDEFSKKNEFHLPRGDKYYAELDFTVGYLRRNILWVAIPHKAP